MAGCIISFVNILTPNFMHSFAFYLSGIWSRLCAGSQTQEARQRSRVFQLLVHVLPFSYSEAVANIVYQSSQVFDISRFQLKILLNRAIPTYYE